MIRNIVFDMAWVLFRYEPMRFTRKYVPDESDAELVHRELFCAPEWLETDRGTLSDEDYFALVSERIPSRLHETARYLYEHWHDVLVPIDEMEPVVSRLKENGYGIYLLSNMSRRFYRFYQNIPAMRYFDGMVVSADERCVKPEKEIYLALFRNYGLLPEECFFIDDRPENVETGRMLGMSGFCFEQNVPALCAALKKTGVRI
ncbi:HAD family phosphatase [Caproiciproducens sp. NJN-50]|uniref:HAD family hydrolase n=1 Tax=Caproiciproducens sp. NJN-50 TaxID=2507162 RepID=UPI000FFE14B5|nr:HAD family phosphatase [Caproiciproducens sp. NJN-50]QAT48857.1 HAD family phosphatase [Caproiciproducens sp. NJN-50]